MFSLCGISLFGYCQEQLARCCRLGMRVRKVWRRRRAEFSGRYGKNGTSSVRKGRHDRFSYSVSFPNPSLKCIWDSSCIFCVDILGEFALEA